jgi:uncharacterized protein YbaA (DUF1428 family)
MYVDGFVIPMPKRNLKAYIVQAKLGKRLWMKHGALDYYECVGDDLNVQFGLGFPKGVRLKPGETAVFSWILFKNKAHRNKVNAAVMKDPIMNKMPPTMPFDPKRMLYGGFKVVVRA